MSKVVNDVIAFAGFDNRITATDFYRIDSILEQIENIGKEINNSIAALIFTGSYNNQPEIIVQIQRDIADLSASCEYLKKIITGILI